LQKGCTTYLGQLPFNANYVRDPLQCKNKSLLLGMLVLEILLLSMGDLFPFLLSKVFVLNENLQYFEQNIGLVNHKVAYLILK
jgi:hypothetical protein